MLSMFLLFDNIMNVIEVIQQLKQNGYCIEEIGISMIQKRANTNYQEYTTVEEILNECTENGLCL